MPVAIVDCRRREEDWKENENVRRSLVAFLRPTSVCDIRPLEWSVPHTSIFLETHS